MVCSPPGSSVHGDSPGKNTGVGCHTLLQGIFPTQGSNPCFPHCRQILYHLSHHGSPWILKWAACPLSKGIFPSQESNQGLLHCRQILYHLSHKASPRILEWAAYPFSRGSSWPRNQTVISSLQVDSLPTEPLVKPKNTGVGSLSLLQGIFPTQESNRGLLHCR